MRKFILSICVFATSIAAFGQTITATSGKSYDIFPGVDYVYFFNGIKPQTEITYNGTGAVEWLKFSNGTTPSFHSNLLTISPDDATGYILKIDGKVLKTIWVIDYSKYLPVLKSVTVPAAQTNECKTVSLAIDADIPALSYQTPASATSLPITRDFNIAYTTLSWNGTAWQDSTANVTVTLPATQKIVKAPYRTTRFTLTGDQYAKDLGIEVTPAVSADYTPIAVVCHETSIVSTRNATNEAERPTTAKQISGSAPFDMQFLSNANEPITQFYKWEIYKDKAVQPFISRTDKDIRNIFTEAGVYKVSVTVSNSKSCTFTDSIMVTVSESQIVAPNVFTPNGDGFNDEFRVAYKSITSFHCWIYNRWGRLVYEWTDPMKGWDGNIGGKKAAPGAYFYIIKALGSDYDPNSKANSKTKLRVGEYKLKGDINLLRGADN
jgi:gliding motility-associated-like protein